MKIQNESPAFKFKYLCLWKNTLLKKYLMKELDILIVGGGAAGFFTAINAAEMNPHASIALLERGKEVLNKVKISGGGRCNVTHAEFNPKELTRNYPRGEKELHGPFHSFMTGDTIAWFEARGVALKIEEDGRMFPVSNSSQSIIDCFLEEVERRQIQLLRKQAVQEFTPKEGRWEVKTKTDTFSAKKLVLTPGSNPKIWQLLEQLGHRIVPPVPSLFTFNVKDERIADLPGVATPASVRIRGELLETQGPLLITHWGLSGPAILKLSAWGARELSLLPEFEIQVNWLLDAGQEEVLQELKALKQQTPKQQLLNTAQLGLPKRLWRNLVAATGIQEGTRWADLSNKQLAAVAEQLTAGIFKVHGKSSFKEEFVTAGGVDLKEVNFKTFESKLHKNLYFAGEVLNIDAITGGFNFQNAWTGGYIAAKAISDGEL